MKRIYAGSRAHQILDSASLLGIVVPRTFANFSFTTPLTNVYTVLKELTKEGLLSKTKDGYIITSRGTQVFNDLPPYNKCVLPTETYGVHTYTHKIKGLKSLKL